MLQVMQLLIKVVSLLFIFNKYKKSYSLIKYNEIVWARSGMIILAIAALIIANIPGMTLLYLFLFFAVLRASVWLPSMISFINPSLINERGMFWVVLVGASVGEILFVSGKLGYTDTTFIGTLIAVFGSPTLAIGISKYR